MNVENWHKIPTNLYLESLAIDFKEKMMGAPAIILTGNDIEIKRFRAGLMRQFRKIIIEINHPFFPTKSLVNEKSINSFFDFFDVERYSLLNLKLPANNFSSENAVDFFNYKDLSKMDGKCIVVNGIDLFDMKSQYLLSKMEEHSNSKNLIIMTFNKDDYMDHFDREMLLNSQRIHLVDEIEDNI